MKFLVDISGHECNSNLEVVSLHHFQSIFESYDDASQWVHDVISSDDDYSIYVEVENGKG